jgi:hypothetical protein
VFLKAAPSYATSLSSKLAGRIVGEELQELTAIGIGLVTENN